MTSESFINPLLYMITARFNSLKALVKLLDLVPKSKADNNDTDNAATNAKHFEYQSSELIKIAVNKEKKVAVTPNPTCKKSKHNGFLSPQ